MSGKDIMSIIKKIFYSLVIICGLAGSYFLITGWKRFYGQRILFFIAIYSCVIGIIVGIFEIIKVPKNKYTEFYKIILGFLGGSALILSSLYLILMTDTSLFIKLTSIFAILFFSIAIIKGIKRINIEQGKEIIVDLDYDDAFEKTKRVLILIKAKVTKDSKNDGIIIAETGLSWKSFGENLLLKLKRVGSKQTQIKILSKPKVRTTMIDFGKNFENVERFYKEILSIGSV